MATFYNAPLNKPRPSNDVFTPLELHLLSTGTYRILKGISDKIRMPISQMIAIAIDNELDAPKPFNYPIAMPESEFVEGSYFDEAKKILDFLKKRRTGMDVETLILCRRDIGVEDRETLLLGLRELLNTSLVEEFFPRRLNSVYREGYTRIRVITQDPRELKKDRFRKKPALAGENDDET